MKISKFYFIFYLAIIYNNAFADQYNLEQIIHTEIIFQDCDKAHTILDQTNNLSSPESKGNLSKYLSRILGIETNTYQIIAPSAGGMGIKNANLSNYLDPERDKKAKLCALSLLQKIDPLSASSIPQLIKLGTDRKNNPELRDQTLSEIRRQTNLIQRQHFPGYILNEIYSQIEEDEQLAKSSYIIPILIALSKNVNISYEKLLGIQNSHLRGHVLTAYIINQHKNPNAIKEISSLYLKIDEGAKAQLVSKLKFIAANHPALIEIIPDFLNTDSQLVKNEILKLIKFLNQNSAIYATHYDKSPFPTESIKKYLELVKSNEIKFTEAKYAESKHADTKNSEINLSSEIIKLLLPISLKTSNEFCNSNNKAESLNPHDFNYETTLYLIKNSLCPYNKEIKNSLTDSLLKKDYTQSIFGLILLSFHEEIDEEILSQALKFTPDIKKKYSPKEFNLLSYLILRSANKISTSKIKQSLIKLALENIENDASGSSLIDLFLPTKSSPHMEYLSSNLKLSDNHLQKKLNDKSPLVIKRALQIYSNPDTEKINLEPQTFTLLTKLLSNNNLEIRRNAYLSIKLHKKETTIISLPNEQQSASTQFYLSRVYLDQDNILNKKDLDSIIKRYTLSLNRLDCRERTIAFPKHIISQLETLTSDHKADLIRSQIECIKESTFTRQRSLKNLASFKNLDKTSVNKIIDEFISTSDFHNESQSIATILEYLEEKESHYSEKLLSSIFDSKQEDNITTAIIWLLKNKNYANYKNENIIKKVNSMTNSDSLKISLHASELKYAMNPSEENLSDLKTKILKNIDQTELIFGLYLSNIFNKEILHFASKEQNAFLNVFVNTSFCAELGESSFCEQIKLSPSMIYDKPSFYKAVLKNLINSPHAGHDYIRKPIKDLIIRLIDSGHIEELLSLNKTAEVVSLLREIRLDTNNLAHSKILDYLIES